MYQIIRKDRGGAGQVWGLEINDALVTLAAPDGSPVLQWAPAQVLTDVQFPSFSRSIKYTSFEIAGAGMLSFDITGSALQELRTFANRGIAIGGPEKIKAVLKTAILTTAFGVALCVAGVICLAITVLEMSGKSATKTGPHPIGAVTALVGFAIACRGIYGFVQYAHVKKLWAEIPMATPTPSDKMRA